MINGRGDTLNQHDILTGLNADGTVATGMTREDWTSNASTSKAFVGHHDRIGLKDDAPSKSWNASHRAAAARRICRKPAAPARSIASRRIAGWPNSQHPVQRFLGANLVVRLNVRRDGADCTEHGRVVGEAE